MTLKSKCRHKTPIVKHNLSICSIHGCDQIDGSLPGRSYP